MNHDLIDEELYSECTRSELIRIWDDAEAFAIELRRTKDSKVLYCQLQALMDKRKGVAGNSI